MCGVIGYAAPAELVSPELLERGLDTLRQRGPDGSGLWVGGAEERTGERRWRAGLGHRRLAIRDLSEAGHQPMLSSCGRYVLSYNGELYEEDKLRARLSGRPITWRGRSDTELLLNLLIYEGRGVLEQLNGIFAFALLDILTGELLLARDRYGVKPLFWSEQNGGVCFASEVKALLSARLVPFELDPQAHVELLALTYTPGPRSAIQGVSQLPPGSWLSWRPPHLDEQGHRAELELGRYWRPSFQLAPPLSLQDAAEELRRLLLRSVEARLVSDVPVGVLLSGGLDSSGLVYAASEVSERPVETFTVRFSEQSFDESHYAALVAKRFGTRHHVELVQPRPEEVFGPLMEALDTPFADSSAIPLWYLCKSARERVTVALGGDGGDELFAGYGTHLAGQLALAYRRAPSAVKVLIKRAVHSLPVSHTKVSLDLKLKQFVHAASAPPPEAHFRFKEFLSEELRAELLRPLFKRLRGAPLTSPADHFTAHFEALSPSHDQLSRALLCDQSLYLPDNILVKGDRVSMGCSLELRVPYLDPELSSFANGLPSHQKLMAWQGKRALKAALSAHLPREVISRRKRGFNVPMAQWLLGDLAPLLDELLSLESIKKYALWDPQVVERMRREHQEMRRDHSRPLWAMLCFMAYMTRHQGA